MELILRLHDSGSKVILEDYEWSVPDSSKMNRPFEPGTVAVPEEGSVDRIVQKESHLALFAFPSWMNTCSRLPGQTLRSKVALERRFGSTSA